MAKQSIVQVGNASICLVGADDPFCDGHTTGYLEFYDERHWPSFPLTTQVIADYLTMMVNEPSMPSLWKAGRLTGWIEALVENAPHTFQSCLLEERITALQEVEKKSSLRGGERADALAPLTPEHSGAEVEHATREKQAPQEEEAPHCGRTLSGHASRDPYSTA